MRKAVGCDIKLYRGVSSFIEALDRALNLCKIFVKALDVCLGLYWFCCRLELQGRSFGVGLRFVPV